MEIHEDFRSSKHQVYRKEGSMKASSQIKLKKNKMDFHHESYLALLLSIYIYIYIYIYKGHSINKF